MRRIDITEASRSGVKLDLYWNDYKASGPCGITVRTSDIREFILRIYPQELTISGTVNDEIMNIVSWYNKTLSERRLSDGKKQ